MTSAQLRIQWGPLDDVDYLAGMGFVASQRYLVSTCSRKKLDKATALKLGPRHGGSHSLARILNAAANYWKHVDKDGDWRAPKRRSFKGDPEMLKSLFKTDKEEPLRLLVGINQVEKIVEGGWDTRLNMPTEEGLVQIRR